VITGRWARNLALVGAAALCSVVLYLFVGPSSAPDPPPDLKTLQHVDGTLTVVEQRRLVMRPFVPLNGKREIEFVIRPRDDRYFDIAHIQSHSSVALPTRIYFEQDGGRYYARFKEDAPVNSRGS
jgi:hypothetical protein